MCLQHCGGRRLHKSCFTYVIYFNFLGPGINKSKREGGRVGENIYLKWLVFTSQHLFARDGYCFTEREGESTTPESPPTGKRGCPQMEGLGFAHTGVWLAELGWMRMGLRTSWFHAGLWLHRAAVDQTPREEGAASK